MKLFLRNLSVFFALCAGVAWFPTAHAATIADESSSDPSAVVPRSMVESFNQHVEIVVRRITADFPDYRVQVMPGDDSESFAVVSSASHTTIPTGIKVTIEPGPGVPLFDTSSGMKDPVSAALMEGIKELGVSWTGSFTPHYSGMSDAEIKVDLADVETPSSILSPDSNVVFIRPAA